MNRTARIFAFLPVLGLAAAAPVARAQAPAAQPAPAQPAQGGMQPAAGNVPPGYQQAPPPQGQQGGIMVVDQSQMPQAAPPPPDERTAKNAVFGSLLGDAIYYSLNYERMVIDDLGVRLGFSYLSVSASAGSASSHSTYLAFPITADYIGIHAGRNALEVGGGLTLFYASGSVSTGFSSASGSGIQPVGTLHVGYRIQPLSAGFLFRVGLSALIGKGVSFNPNPSKIQVLPWPYVSFGGVF